jgi:hypothetical protein
MSDMPNESMLTPPPPALKPPPPTRTAAAGACALMSRQEERIQAEGAGAPNCGGFRNIQAVLRLFERPSIHPSSRRRCCRCDSRCLNIRVQFSGQLLERSRRRHGRGQARRLRAATLLRKSYAANQRDRNNRRERMVCSHLVPPRLLTAQFFPAAMRVTAA